jgi:hypothetical protein
MISDLQSEEPLSGNVQIILIFVGNNVPCDDADEIGHMICIKHSGFEDR